MLRGLMARIWHVIREAGGLIGAFAVCLLCVVLLWAPLMLFAEGGDIFPWPWSQISWVLAFVVIGLMIWALIRSTRMAMERTKDRTPSDW